ncbi:TetR/AcrR family transcriptional regulator C-terminal domain-containing protein [Plantactinospora solaniradicis]|uniref:TetR/AcrR family transcriptional regulator C-terminal domain-containing protein n=1 Tax=Plantactinospora solaniradicis TaxID=1723736 RepID=A0ABW1K060_9ACTN
MIAGQVEPGQDHHDGGDAEERIRDTMTQASETAMQFPRLRARLESAAAAEYGAAPDDSFEFGLRAIFDGLEAQFAARRAPAVQT